MGKCDVQLADKVSALMHSWALECDDSEALLVFLERFHSFTSDLGVDRHVRLPVL